jgi:hypothetical protein
MDDYGSCEWLHAPLLVKLLLSSSDVSSSDAAADERSSEGLLQWHLTSRAL